MDISKAYSTKTPLIASSPTPSVQGVCEQAAIGFEDAYTTNEPERMPWFWADLDPDFVTSLSSYGLPVGSVIDLGGGSGTQAIALAKRGFQTTSTDFSLGAIEGGKRLAKEQSVNVDFIVDDVTNSRLTSQYDLVLDRGCFHIIAPARREIISAPC
jgi:2-polyprenyl-3-methyl-5-hydroxy-6-metoxy-1,4-benzoquinol methylase